MESSEDLFGQGLFDFGVSRNGLGDSVFRIEPERVIAAFALEIATRHAKASLEVTSLHPSIIFSWMLSSESPRV